MEGAAADGVVVERPSDKLLSASGRRCRDDDGFEARLRCFLRRAGVP